ncbi:hypothetical protein BOX15_Mlig021297g1 [Macrostomum lignano]|uniref:DUF4550 domain-containing protein n=2 Tax=Macrostomum lignano TaxID=282301 RepID=A0A1I8GVN6_9PLAT|nr:hypothetical protein BOX15_Mlig021297g2 [Macrostomum lignano]PAA74880.1 hypothetical protein BOX15_Mlig021297g3 [Macrostomum lignano]PAA85181.1 hypothetical protein BOX15_Mlig021297g1 [Macrostomum lignano]
MSGHQHQQGQQLLQAPRSRSGGRNRTNAGGDVSPAGSEGSRSELMTPATALHDETPPPDDDGPGIVTRDLTFETRPVRRRKTKEAPPPGTHDVTFYVTIAFAVPMSITEEDPGGDGRKLNYYHVEYRVFPDELIKADVVLFGHEAAKVFADSGQSSRSEYRNVKLWGDGDDLWVVWQQSYQAAVTDSTLMSLSTHRFELKIWDAKEKCSTKAKYDRTRNFKFPAAPIGRDERQYGVRGTLARLSRLYERKIPTRLWLNRPLPHETMAMRDAALAASREATEAARAEAGDAGDETAAGRRRTGRGRRSGGALRSTQQQLQLQQQQRDEFGLYAVTKFDGLGRPQTFNKLTRLAGASGPDPDDFKVRQNAGRPQQGPASSSATAAAPPATGRSGELSGIDELSRLGSAVPGAGGVTDRASELDGEGGGVGGTSSAAGKARGKRQVHPEWERNGRVRIELNLAALFTTDCVIERLVEPAQNLEDAFVMLCISEPLLSDAQKESLNPLSIRIRSVQCMPLEPYGQQGLRDRCEPVYCQYTFFDQPLHRTAGREHGEKVVWDDVQVVLTGRKDPVSLCEYAKGPGFWLEIHDRDRRPEEQRLEPALFGDDLEDEKISSVGLVSAKRTQYGAFPGSRVRAWDPHGRARVDLSGLLHGQRLIEAEIPIQRCEPPSPLGVGSDAGNRVPGIAGAVDGPTQTPLEAGDFTNSGATVKVMLQLARPLAGGINRPARFGRIVLTFDYHNVALLHRLRAMLRSINAAAFDLSSLPEHAIATALTSRKLEADSSGSAQQQQQQQAAAEEAAVSGFHLADGRRHLFVVEGPAGQGVASVWAAMQPRGPGDDLHVMFNAEVTFSKRLYGSLGLDFPCIRLYDRLEAILEQSVLYVRDTVPRDCFLCLSKLGSLLTSKSMMSAVKSENFPTPGMLASLTKEFSVPVGIDDMIHMESGPAPAQQVRDAAAPAERAAQGQPVARSRPSQTAAQTPAQTAISGIQRSRTCPDFVRSNVRSVQVKSAAVADERRQRLAEAEARRGPPATSPTPAYNYSTQALNSTELALAEIRRRMRPDRRYTYMPEYHAAGTLAPVDVKRLSQEAAADSQARWLSPAGWACPGHKTSAEANVHPRRPDPARLDALAEPWSENDLHAAQLQPSVPGREPLSWPERRADLDLWRQSRGPFGQEPHSIFPTGDVKDAEVAEVANRERADWEAAVVVDSTRIRTHRRLPGTEMTERGHNAASNQLDRLTGLLKDPAVKFGFIYPGVRDVPALAVHAGNSGADQAGSQSKAFMPGDREGRSLAVDYLERPEQGRGFRLICDTKSPVHKRHAPPLTESERRAQLHATARSFLALPAAGAKSAPVAKQQAAA